MAKLNYEQSSLRQLILQRIYEMCEGNCYQRISFKSIADYFRENNNIEWKQLLPSISYLDQKGLIKSDIIKSIDGNMMYTNTSITIDGIEYIESKADEKYSLASQNSSWVLHDIKDSIITIGDNNVQGSIIKNPELDKLLSLTNDLIEKLPGEEALHDIKIAIEQKKSGIPTGVDLNTIKNQLFTFAASVGLKLAEYGLLQAFGG